MLLSNVFRFTKSKRMAEKKDGQNEDTSVYEKYRSANFDPNEAPSFISGDKSLEANMKWDF